MIVNDFKNIYKRCVISPRPEYSFYYRKKHTVFSSDCVFAQKGRKGKHCDEFVFVCLNQNRTGIYLVERKDTHNANVKKIKEQLQGGADCIAGFLRADAALATYKPDFIPVLASLEVSQSTLRQLVATKISLCGKPKRISLLEKRRKLPKF